MAQFSLNSVGQAAATLAGSTARLTLAPFDSALRVTMANDPSRLLVSGWKSSVMDMQDTQQWLAQLAQDVWARSKTASKWMLDKGPQAALLAAEAIKKIMDYLWDALCRLINAALAPFGAKAAPLNTDQLAKNSQQHGSTSGEKGGENGTTGGRKDLNEPVEGAGQGLMTRPTTLQNPLAPILAPGSQSVVEKAASNSAKKYVERLAKNESEVLTMAAIGDPKSKDALAEKVDLIVGQSDLERDTALFEAQLTDLQSKLTVLRPAIIALSQAQGQDVEAFYHSLKERMPPLQHLGDGETGKELASTFKMLSHQFKLADQILTMHQELGQKEGGDTKVHQLLADFKTLLRSPSPRTNETEMSRERVERDTA